MDGKITLITPPDIFENSNLSILFFHISEEEQDFISKWLSNSDLKINLNFYVYTDETNLPWIFYAFGQSEYKYINFDNSNTITQALGSYLLSKNNVYYKTKDENLAAIFSHINSNKIHKIESFLERVLIDQRN
jgi:hypothetical protein